MRTYVANNHRLQEEVEPKPERVDFCEGFTNNLGGLYQLSFLLTRDHEKAERCFVAGLDNFTRGNRAFNQWALSWTKRIIVENAVRELKPRPGPSHSPSSTSDFRQIGQLSSEPDGHFTVQAILALEDFERFVFVLSILDHYSPEECAVFLGSSLSQIREARMRALKKLTSLVDIVFPDNKILEDPQKHPR